MEKKKNNKILIICGVILTVIAIALIIFFSLSTMPSKNIGKWTSTSTGYSVDLKLYENNKFELNFNINYILGTIYNTNVNYKGTYKYFNGKITLFPDNEDVEYKGNFGDNRLTLTKVENGETGEFIEFKK